MSKYIYFSGQQTVKTAKLISDLMNSGSATALFTSSPNFNLPKNNEQVEIWKDINKTEINQPCYGFIVEFAADYAERYGYEVKRNISKSVLEKAIKHSKVLLEVLYKLNHIVAFNNLTKYVNGLNDILSGNIIINSKNEWYDFLINMGLKDNLELNLDLYLTNFDDTLTLDNIEEIYSHIPELKNNSRWLTKVGYYPNGCYADVRNLIEILTINKHKLPSIYIMDCENDDLASLKILESLHSENRTTMNVYLQLPSELENDKRKLNTIMKTILTYTDRCEILFDPESSNMEVLNDFYIIDS